MKFKAIFNNIKEKISGLYKSNKKLFFAFIAVLIVAAIVLFLPLESSKSNQSNSEQTENISPSLSYAEMLENKLANMLLKVSNIKSAKVLVMVDSSEKYIYLTQSESTKTGESEVLKEEVVYEKNGSSQSPIKVMTEYPKVSGVMIVTNKIDASTKISIQNAIAGVLNIDSTCIFILQDG